MLAGLSLAALAMSPVTVEVQVDPKHRLIEGIATDGSDVYLSSPFDKTILVCRERRCDRELKQGDANVVPMGLSWDSQRSWLWVALSCPKPIATECEHGAVRMITRDGALSGQIVPETGKFQIGDLWASPHGEVLIGDSSSGALSYVGQDGHTIQPVLWGRQGKSAQSAVRLPDGRIITSDYSEGVGVVDAKTGKLTRPLKENGQPIRGIDGMVLAGDRIFAIYNGQEPGALIEIMLLPGNGIAYRNLFDTDSPIHDATQLAVDGEDLLVIVGSGWASIDKARREDKGAQVLRIPIPPRNSR